MVGTKTFLAAALLALCSCRARDENKQRQATEQAESRAQETTITSGTLEAFDASPLADDDVLRSRAEALVALRREQLDYRGRLQHAVDELDLAVAKGRDGGRLDRPVDRATAARVRRRAALASDIAALDRSTEEDWPGLRARIEKELAAAEEDIPR